MVLDGAYDFFSVSGDEQLRRQSIGFEGALAAFLANCGPSCPFARNGSARGGLDALLASVEAAPIAVPSADRPLGPGEANLGVSFGLYSRSYWPMLTAAITNALAGNGALLLSMADAYLQREPDRLRLAILARWLPRARRPRARVGTGVRRAQPAPERAPLRELVRALGPPHPAARRRRPAHHRHRHHQ
jgi:hypothetical protein